MPLADGKDVFQEREFGAAGPGGNMAPQSLPDLLVALGVGGEHLVDFLLRLAADRVLLRMAAAERRP